LLAPVLVRLEKEYPEDLRVVFRHFPLSGHINSLAAAQAAEAAGLQGKFWEMHDLLFERQAEFGELTPEEFQDWIVQRAVELGLDGERFKKDMNSAAIVKLVKDAQEYNQSIGMPGTPYLLFNNEPYAGRLDYASLKAVIDLTLLEKHQFSDCPPMKVDPAKKYFATLHTEKGDITIELFADKAPMAVNNFIFLAQQGWYDGVTFHRVIPGFVAQAGDPSGTGYGGPGYAFDNEIASDLTFNGPGVVGMANAGPGSNGSQFFITFTATPNLDGGYTIFGRVIAGMDVAEKLTARDPSQTMDLPPGDKILSITIEVK
jgi:cyclophilin family peptidyl-prolyl cis-trans isomerase